MDTKMVQSTLQSPISQQLYLAFELSQKVTRRSQARQPQARQSP